MILMAARLDQRSRARWTVCDPLSSYRLLLTPTAWLRAADVHRNIYHDLTVDSPPAIAADALEVGRRPREHEVKSSLSGS
jgi:hypothetical protein